MGTFHFNLRGGGSQKPKTASKGCLVLFAGVFLLFGLLMMGLIVRDVFLVARTRKWQETPCVVRSSEVVEHPMTAEKAPEWEFKVSYAYEVKGRPYSATTYSLRYEASEDEGETRRLLGRYPVGTKTSCYVDPDDPTRAVLVHEALVRKGAVVGLIVALVFAGGATTGIVLTLRWKGKEEGKGKSISEKAKPRAVGYAVVIFFLVFFLAGAGVFGGFFLPAILRVLKAKTWVETPCEILESGVKSHSGSKGRTTYSVAVLYKYTVDGKEYRSNRHQFLGGSSSGHGAKAEVVKRLPPGTKTVCYVNPADPKEAVLNRDFTSDMWFAGIPIVFMLVGLGGLIGTVVYVRKKRAAPARPEWMPEAPTDAAAAQRGLAAPAQWGPAAPGTGPVTLKPKSSTGLKLAGMLAFSLFWNGVVFGFLVRDVMRGWQAGKPDWFQTLFAIPFVVVGVGSALGVFYFIMACFNPRPRLVVGSSMIPLGGTLEVKWEILGSTHRINRFRITLEGKEEAQYQQGKNTTTDTQIFFRQHVVDTDDPNAIAAGEASLVVPPDTMHSFETASNKIIWSLVVHGEISMWPDVKAEFPIVIQPLAAGG